MKKGTNDLFLTAKVISIKVGETAGNEEAASSIVLSYGESKSSDDKNGSITRANGYGDIARIMASSIKNGDMVYIRGELMARKSSGGVHCTEIRVHQIHRIGISSGA